MTSLRSVFEEADRLNNVIFSPIREVTDKAGRLQAEGRDVIYFSAGEPNFNTPEPIKQATIQAINDNFSHYCSNRGMIGLRREIAKKIQEDTGVAYDPETEIIVTSSGAEAINNALLSSISQGDEVLLFSPAFISYECLIHQCGGKVVYVPLKDTDGYQIDVEQVEKRITGKTTMIVMNNPCNPTGAVFSSQSLEKLARLAVEHNLLVFADEIYNRLVYDGASFTSIASFPGMRERTIMMNGFSKTYAMTGWRVGYLAADKRMTGKIMKVHQYSTTTGVTFIQEGLARAMNLEDTRREVSDMVDAFARRRRLAMEKLDEIEGLSYVKPYGAFYIMVNVSSTGLSGEEFAFRLLEEKYVAVVPAVGLGKECGDYIRLSYAASDENLLRGFKRIKDFVEGL